MGNQAITSHFSAQRSLEGRWETIGRTAYGSTVIINRLTGEEAEMQSVQTWSIDTELQLYDARTMPVHNVVQVYTVEPQNKQTVCHPDVLQVVTERIPHRLAEARNMPLGQSLFVLHQSLQGYQEIHDGMGIKLVNVTDSMIGITSSGDVRVWINERFGENTVETSGLAIVQQNASPKIRMFLLNLYNVVEGHTVGQAFPNDFKDKWNPSSFSEGQTIIEKYCQKKGITMMRVNSQVQSNVGQGGGIVSNIQPSEISSPQKDNKTMFASTIVRESVAPMEVREMVQAMPVVSVIPPVVQPQIIEGIQIAPQNPNIFIEESPRIVLAAQAPVAQVVQNTQITQIPVSSAQIYHNSSPVKVTAARQKINSEALTPATLPVHLTNARQANNLSPKNMAHANNAIQNAKKLSPTVNRDRSSTTLPRQPSPTFAGSHPPQRTIQPSASAKNIQARRSSSPLNNAYNGRKSIGQIEKKAIQKHLSIEIDKPTNNSLGTDNNVNIGIQVRPSQPIQNKKQFHESNVKEVLVPRQTKAPKPQAMNSLNQRQPINSSPYAATKMEPIVRISGANLSNGLPHFVHPQNGQNMHHFRQTSQQINQGYFPPPPIIPPPPSLYPVQNSTFAFSYDPSRLSQQINVMQTFSPTSPTFNQQNQALKEQSLGKSLEDHLLEVHRPGLSMNRQSKLNIQTTEYTNQNSYFFKPEHQGHYSHPWIDHSDEKQNLNKMQGDTKEEPKSPKKEKDPQPIEIIENKVEEKAPEKKPQLIVSYDEQPQEEAETSAHEEALNILSVPVIQIMEYMPEKGVQFPEAQISMEHVEYREPSKVAVSYAETEIARRPVSPQKQSEHLAHIRKESGPYEHIFHSDEGEGQPNLDEEDQEDEEDEVDEVVDSYHNKDLLEAGARIILDEEPESDSPVKETSSLLIGIDGQMPKKIVSKYETVLVDSINKKNERQVDRNQEIGEYESGKYESGNYDSKYDSKYNSKFDQKYNSKYDSKYDEKYDNRYESKYDSKYDSLYDKYEKKYAKLEQRDTYAYLRTPATPDFQTSLQKADDYFYLKKYQNIDSNMQHILIHDKAYSSLSNPTSQRIPDKIKKYDYGVSRYEENRGSDVIDEVDRLIRRYEKGQLSNTHSLSNRPRKELPSTYTLPHPEQPYETKRYPKRKYELSTQDEPIVIFSDRLSTKSQRKTHTPKGSGHETVASYNDLRRWLHEN